MEKKLFVVDTISTFRLRYVIEAENVEDAYDEVAMIDSDNADNSFDELTQKFLGEMIIDGREITKAQFDTMLLDLENDKTETSSHWMGESMIRRVAYPVEVEQGQNDEE